MHLYFHVPFCARRCSYCDFAIAVRRATPSAAYREAVLTEWRGLRESPLWEDDGVVRTIYFGGGTPSRLEPEELATILAGVRADRIVEPGAEVTLEANPEDVTADRAAAWLAAGITRVSLGAQSFDPAVLAWMHRTHAADDTRRAVRILRDAGLDRLSLDLIYAVPEALERDWDRDLEVALTLDPGHLSLYALTVEAGTPLSRWTARGECRVPSEARAAEEFLAAQAALRAVGYEAYEVSSAARAGQRSRHNSAYWDRSSFLGLGPSAHSGTAQERWWNVRDWEAYRRRILEGAEVVAARERLDDRAIRLERLYLGLRTDRGVWRDAVPAALADRWAEAGWAVADAERLRLTPEGWLRLDALVAAVPDP